MATEAENWKEAVNRQTRASRGITTAPDMIPALNKGMNAAMREMHRETYGQDRPAFDRHKSGE